MKPLIAVTPDFYLPRPQVDSRGAFCAVNYTDAIQEAGGVPLILPLTNDRSTLDDLLKRSDGLLLIGGGDIGHQLYAPRLSAKLRATIKDVDPVRDEMELHLVHAALKRGMPVFGICRGVQIMNVALGGTLVPDVPGHRNPTPDALCQTIEWESPSAMQRVLGTRRMKVNTSHHQTLARVARGLRVVARSEDGTIEAVEHTKREFFWGVQFHPERLVRVAPRVRRLFKAFVAAARKT